MTQQFIVSVPGRTQPICIEADSYEGISGNVSGAKFIKDGEVVASLATTDLVARSTCLPAFPELEQFQAPDLALPDPACLASFAEPVRALEPLPAQTITSFNSCGVPAYWPFMLGGALGFIGGFALALSRGWFL